MDWRGVSRALWRTGGPHESNRPMDGRRIRSHYGAGRLPELAGRVDGGEYRGFGSNIQGRKTGT